MTKARILRTASLEALRSNVDQNLARYRQGDFSFLVNDDSHFRELECDVDSDKLEKLLAPAGNNLFEVENCLILNQAMSQLSPYEARDERLWVYMTHTVMLDHVRKRWPIPKENDEAASYIRKHFFARDKRQVERDNAASRLWWMGHLCNRVSGLSAESALKAFLHKSDVRANIIERPTSSQSVSLFSAILKKLHESLLGKQVLFKREEFRAFMSNINSIGGFKLLDSFDDKGADELIEEVIRNKMGLQEL